MPTIEQVADDAMFFLFGKTRNIVELAQMSRTGVVDAAIRVVRCKDQTGHFLVNYETKPFPFSTLSRRAHFLDVRAYGVLGNDHDSYISALDVTLNNLERDTRVLQQLGCTLSHVHVLEGDVHRSIEYLCSSRYLLRDDRF